MEDVCTGFMVVYRAVTVLLIFSMMRLASMPPGWLSENWSMVKEREGIDGALAMAILVMAQYYRITGPRDSHSPSWKVLPET